MPWGNRTKRKGTRRKKAGTRKRQPLPWASTMLQAPQNGDGKMSGLALGYIEIKGDSYQIKVTQTDRDAAAYCRVTKMRKRSSRAGL